MFREIILFLFVLFVVVASYASVSLEEAYKHGSGVVQANRQKAMDDLHNMKPADIFKNYNDNPSQTNYYQGVTQIDTEELKNAANAELNRASDKQDDSLGAVKTAIESYKKRPKLDIKVDDPNNPWMIKSSNIMKNAADIVTGNSNTREGVNCVSGEICRIEYYKESCNEATRALNRVCEKAPKVNVVVKDLIYPNCKNVIVTQHWHTHCPGGYHEFLYSDMIRHVIYDDIRICLKVVSEREGAECFGGHLVYGIGPHTNNRIQNIGKVTIPKKVRSRLRFSQVFSGEMHVTIVNETTGKTIHDDVGFKDGQAVELPFSESHDQTFRFENKSKRITKNRSWWQSHHRYDKGVMILYVDHISKDHKASITWQETCNDV